MALERKIFANGGMDSDTEDRFIQQGDYRLLINGRAGSAEDDDVGAITNLKGNTLVTFTLPGGINKVIGKFEDKAGGRVFYFVFNSDSIHQILEYSIKNNLIVRVLQQSLLNFQEFKYIWHVNLVNGNLLYWTDKFNEPRKINIDRIRSKKGYPAVLKEYMLNQLKAPPAFPPKVEYGSDNTLQVNNLRGSLFQFRSWYEYFDKEQSAHSPLSKTETPVSEVNIPKNIFIDAAQDNTLKIKIKTGDEEVKKIHIAARRGDGRTGGDFFLIATLDKEELSLASNIEYEYIFLNDGIYSSIEKQSDIKPFDAVPKRSACQEFIENFLVHASITEGYKQVKTDLTVTPIYNTPPDVFSKPQPTILNLNNFSRTICFPDPDLGDTFIVEFMFAIVNSNEDKVHNNFTSKKYTFKYIADANDKGEDVATAFQTMINTVGITHPYDEVTYKENGWGQEVWDSTTPMIVSPLSISRSGKCLSANLVQGLNELIIRNVYNTQISHHVFDFQFNIFIATRASATGVRKTFKAGAKHEIAIGYFDYGNRNYGVITNPKGVFYTDHFTQPSHKKGTIDVKVEIRNAPPEWATHYQLYYTGNQTKENAIQFLTGTITKIGDAFDRLKISLKPIFQYTNEFTGNIISYGFTKGDRMVVLDSTITGTQLIDVEILSSTIDTLDEQTIIVQNVFTPKNNILIEIYTPKKKIEEKLYYEIGECYPITNGLHTGNVQTQTSSLPAIILLQNQGDYYFKSRIMPNLSSMPAFLPVLVEEQNFSDFYLSNHHNFGRSNLKNTTEEISLPCTFYVSEPIIQNTDINGLNSFFGFGLIGRAKDYDIIYGDVVKIYAEGKRIFCFQELKVGQILARESVIYDQLGIATINKSNEILSDIIYYNGEYGIGNHPGSFAVYGMRKYFADPNRGAVLRLSQDGITPISEYKMHNHFTDLFKEALKGDIYMTACYDVKFSQYILTILSTINTFVVGSFIQREQIEAEQDVSGGQLVLRIADATQLANVDTAEIRMQTGTFQLKTLQLKIVNTISKYLGGTDAVFFEIPLGRESEIASAIESIQVAQGGVPQMEIIFKKSLVKQTIAFNENTNRWTTFYSYNPEFLSGAAIDIVSFKDGELWKHNTNPAHNTFYGKFAPTELEFLSNEKPFSNKFYLAMEQQSNSSWSVKATNQNGQETELIIEDFEKIEDTFWAAFLRDKNSIGGLIEGEDMRGKEMKIRMSNNSANFVKLLSVGIRHKESMLTNA